MKYAVAILALLALAFALGACTRPSGFTFTQVTYTLQGGIGGLNLQMSVQADGTFQVNEASRAGPAKTLPSAQLQELKQLMGKVNWAGLAPNYTDPSVADALLEGIVLKGAGKQDYTTVVGTGGAPPAELAALMAKLQVIMKENRP
jgi:hypothetical protein